MFINFYHLYSGVANLLPKPIRLSGLVSTDSSRNPGLVRTCPLRPPMDNRTSNPHVGRKVFLSKLESEHDAYYAPPHISAIQK